jgi:hypothetical protein
MAAVANPLKCSPPSPTKKIPGRDFWVAPGLSAATSIGIKVMFNIPIPPRQCKPNSTTVISTGTALTTCPTCGASPCINPSFCAVCRDADRRRAQAQHAPSERYNEAPEATYNAVVYELRNYGVSQLSKPNSQRRLSDLSTAQIKNLMAGLQQRRSQYPKVTDELLMTLATIYDARTCSNE